MKYLNSKIIIFCVFFAATALLIFYLLSIRLHIYLSVILFWMAITLMLGITTYQSFNIESARAKFPSYTNVVLLEIIVTCFVFHLIYQIPFYGLRGADAYEDLAAAKGILSSGFVMGDPQYIIKKSFYPIIHIFGVLLSLITSIELFSVTKWFPSLVDIALILLLYLLVRSIFKEDKIALLSVLLFTCLQHHILFSSLFIRETIALVLAVCSIYLYFSAKHFPHPHANYALCIVCLIETVFAHHLTSFMLLIFILIHFLLTNASVVPSFQRALRLRGEKITTVFLSIALIATFAYWTLVTKHPINILATTVRNLLRTNQWGMGTYSEITGIGAASIQTIRGYIMFYGFFSFHFIFGLILLSELLTRVKKRRVETYSFTLFLFFNGLMGLLYLYVIATWASPDRFLMFGWLFGFPPLVVAILKVKYKWPKRIGVSLLVAFMFFNIYMIEPPAWDARAEEVPTATSEENYALATTFNFSNGKIFGSQNSLMAIYDVHNNLGTIFSSAEVDLTKFDWVIIERKELELEKRYYREPRTETIAALERLVTGYTTNYNKIYESNSQLVFAGVRQNLARAVPKIG